MRFKVWSSFTEKQLSFSKHFTILPFFVDQFQGHFVSYWVILSCFEIWVGSEKFFVFSSYGLKNFIFQAFLYLAFFILANFGSFWIFCILIIRDGGFEGSSYWLRIQFICIALSCFFYVDQFQGYIESLGTIVGCIWVWIRSENCFEFFTYKCKISFIKHCSLMRI